MKGSETSIAIPVLSGIQNYRTSRNVVDARMWVFKFIEVYYYIFFPRRFYERSELLITNISSE